MLASVIPAVFCTLLFFCLSTGFLPAEALLFLSSVTGFLLTAALLFLGLAAGFFLHPLLFKLQPYFFCFVRIFLHNVISVRHVPDYRLLFAVFGDIRLILSTGFIQNRYSLG